MAPMVKHQVTVQPGEVVQVHSAELVPGSTADVIIIPDVGAVAAPTLAGLIGSAPGGFASPAEVDAFIRRERDIGDTAVARLGDNSGDTDYDYE